MNILLLPGPRRELIAAFASSEPRPLSIAVIYEDLMTREFAIATHQHLKPTLAEFDFECTWWKMDFFHHLGFADMAAEAAAKADIILFSIHAKTDLQLIKAWVERWFHRHAKNQGALVALIEAKDEQTMLRSPVRSFLRHVADEIGMDFFGHWVAGRAKTCNCGTVCDCSLENINVRANTITPLLQEMLSRIGEHPEKALAA